MSELTEFELKKAALAKQTEDRIARIQRNADIELARIQALEDEHEAHRLLVLDAEANIERVFQSAIDAVAYRGNVISSYQRVYMEYYKQHALMIKITNSSNVAKATMDAAMNDVRAEEAQVATLTSNLLAAENHEKLAKAKLNEAKGNEAVKLAMLTWEKSYNKVHHASTKSEEAFNSLMQKKQASDDAEDKYMVIHDELKVCRENVDKLKADLRMSGVLQAFAIADQRDQEVKEAVRVCTKLKRKHVSDGIE
jgi:hypothetical protein